MTRKKHICIATGCPLETKTFMFYFNHSTFNIFNSLKKNELSHPSASLCQQKIQSKITIDFHSSKTESKLNFR